MGAAVIYGTPRIALLQAPLPPPTPMTFIHVIEVHDKKYFHKLCITLVLVPACVIMIMFMG
jgi:hypothetical protein